MFLPLLDFSLKLGHGDYTHHFEGNASLLHPFLLLFLPWEKLLHTFTVFVPRQSAVCTDLKSLEKRKPSFLE